MEQQLQISSKTDQLNLNSNNLATSTSIASSSTCSIQSTTSLTFNNNNNNNNLQFYPKSESNPITSTTQTTSSAIASQSPLLTDYQNSNQFAMYQQQQYPMVNNQFAMTGPAQVVAAPGPTAYPPMNYNYFYQVGSGGGPPPGAYMAPPGHQASNSNPYFNQMYPPTVDQSQYQPQSTNNQNTTPQSTIDTTNNQKPNNLDSQSITPTKAKSKSKKSDKPANNLVNGSNGTATGSDDSQQHQTSQNTQEKTTSPKKTPTKKAANRSPKKQKSQQSNHSTESNENHQETVNDKTTTNNINNNSNVNSNEEKNMNSKQQNKTDNNDDDEPDTTSPTNKSPSKNKAKKPTAKSVAKRQLANNSISSSSSSSSSSSLSNDDSNENKKLLNEENTNEESTSSSSSNTKSSSQKQSSTSNSPSPLSFNINNLLSSNTNTNTNPTQAPNQMLPPPSPSSNASTSSTNSSSKNSNVPSPSSSSSSSSSSVGSSSPSTSTQANPTPQTNYPFMYNQQAPPYYNKPTYAMQYPAWKQQQQQQPVAPPQMLPPVQNEDKKQADYSNLSYTQDEEDSSMHSIDEPSCSSPKQTSSISSSSSNHAVAVSAKTAAHNAEVLSKLVEMSQEDSAQRKEFVNRMQKIWEDYSVQCRNLPSVNKQVLDLYKLYTMVKERGGFSECNKSKQHWKDISSGLNTGSSAPAALNIKKKYISLGIFHYECKYDLNGVDPLPIIADMEKSKISTSGSGSKVNNNNSEQQQPSTPTMNNSNSNLPTTPTSKKKKSSSKDKKSEPTPPPPPAAPTPVPPVTTTPTPQTNSVNTPVSTPAPNPTSSPVVIQQQQVNPQYNQHYNPTSDYNHQYNPQQQQQPPIYNAYQPQANYNAYPGQPRAYNQQQAYPQQIYPAQRMYNPQEGAMYPNQVRYPAPVQQTQQQQAPIMPPQTQHPYSYNPQPQVYPQQPQQAYPQQAHHMPQQQQNSLLSSKLAQTQQQPILMNQQNQQQVFNRHLMTPQPTVQQVQVQQVAQPVQPVQQQTQFIQQQQQQQNVHHAQAQATVHLQQKPILTNQVHQVVQQQPQQSTIQNQIPNQLPAFLVPSKKEITFPPESIEATIPVETKKRKIYSKDIGPCDPWKLYMSLKSGLLAESTWALDALNILLYDDNTIAYFHLKHFPGLVNILIEHYLKCLKLIFNESNGNEFKDLNLNNQYTSNGIDQNNDNSFADLSDYDEDDDDDEEEENENEDDKIDSDNNQSGSGYSDSECSDNEELNSPSKNAQINKIKNKQLNGYHNNNNNLNKYNQENNNKQNNDSDKHHILRVYLTDKEIRNRYAYFYSTAYKTSSIKYNDYKACQEWFTYNKKLIQKYSNTFSTFSSKKTKKSSSKFKRLKSSNDDSQHILTHFSNQNDLSTLNKLFYGSNNIPIEQFTHQQEKQQQQQKMSKKESIINEKIIQSNTNGKLNSNEEFIRRHKTKQSNEKQQFLQDLKYDDQAVQDEDCLFKIVNQRNTELMNRCTSISTVLRNLSFVPGNDLELCKNNLLLKIFARIIVLKHEHKLVLFEKNQTECENNKNLENFFNYLNTENKMEQDKIEEEEEYLDDELDCIKELKNKNFIYKQIQKSTTNQTTTSTKTTETKNENTKEWWWECVHILRENTLVCLANIAGALNLNNLDEDIVEFYSHGLIHWSICKSTEAQDTMCTLNDTSLLSPQRLAIETLSKMTVIDTNVDLILNCFNKMRPFLDSFVSILCSEWLNRRDEQTLREFAIVLVAAMAKCDQFAARSIAKYTSCLISFIEDFEDIARRHYLHNPNHIHYHPHFNQINRQQNNQHHHHHSNNNNKLLNEDTSNINEENLGTTIDMLRRCSNTIMYLSMYSENIPFIMKHESRLLDLITSQFVDFKVAQILAEVLFYCSSNSQKL